MNKIESPHNGIYHLFCIQMVFFSYKLITIIFIHCQLINFDSLLKIYLGNGYASKPVGIYIVFYLYGLISFVPCTIIIHFDECMLKSESN